jgi:peptidylprolyl isomerase
MDSDERYEGYVAEMDLGETRKRCVSVKGDFDMTRPRTGDTVKVRYTGRLDDGRVFASARTQEPLELTVGEGTLIPGVEDTLTRMEPGEERTVTIPAERAYGPHHPELVVAVDRAEFPEDIEPEVGQELQVQQGDAVIVMRVAEVSAERVMIDANHPLAGQNLTFELELVEIRGHDPRRDGGGSGS